MASALPGALSPYFRKGREAGTQVAPGGGEVMSLAILPHVQWPSPIYYNVLRELYRRLAKGGVVEEVFLLFKASCGPSCVRLEALQVVDHLLCKQTRCSETLIMQRASPASTTPCVFVSFSPVDPGTSVNGSVLLRLLMQPADLTAGSFSN